MCPLATSLRPHAGLLIPPMQRAYKYGFLRFRWNYIS